MGARGGPAWAARLIPSTHTIGGCTRAPYACPGGSWPFRRLLVAAVLSAGAIFAESAQCGPGAYRLNTTNASAANVTQNGTAGACVSCPVGRYQDAANDGEACKSCPTGRYGEVKGLQECALCHFNTYQQKSGQTNCRRCPAHTSTCRIDMSTKQLACHRGTTKESECKCNAGYFRGENISGSVPKAGAGLACRACPVGGLCCVCPEIFSCYQPGATNDTCKLALLMRNLVQYRQPCETCFVGPTDDERPLVAPGFYRHVTPAENRSDLLSCAMKRPASKVEMYGDDEETRRDMTPPWRFDANELDIAGRCRGGPESTCAAGNRGFLCAECDAGYIVGESSDVCIRCGGSRAARRRNLILVVVAFVFVLAPIGIALLYISLSDPSATQAFVYMRLFTDHFQLLSLNRNVAGDWPKLQLQIFEASSASTVNVNLLSLECGFSITYTQKYYLVIFFPLMLGGLMYCMTCVVYLIYKRNLAKRQAMSQVSGDSGEGDGSAGSGAAAAALGALSTLATDAAQTTDDGGNKADDIISPRKHERTTASGPPAYVEQHWFFSRFPGNPDDWEAFSQNFEQVYLMTLTFQYIALADHTISIFDCVDLGQGKWYMTSHPRIECFSSSEWRGLAMIGIPAIALFAFGIPFLLRTLFWVNHSNIIKGQRGVLRRFGFLFKCYRQDMYYYDIVVLLRKLTFVVVTRIGHGAPFLQALLAVLCYFFFFSMHQLYRPYRQEKHNVAAGLFLVANFTIIFSSILFMSDSVGGFAKTVVMAGDFVLLLTIWVMFASQQWRDCLLYLNLTMFLGAKAEDGTMDPELIAYYATVDEHGVVDNDFHDMLVTRNRYEHKPPRQRIAQLAAAGWLEKAAAHVKAAAVNDSPRSLDSEAGREDEIVSEHQVASDHLPDRGYRRMWRYHNLLRSFINQCSPEESSLPATEGSLPTAQAAVGTEIESENPLSEKGSGFSLQRLPKMEDDVQENPFGGDLSELRPRLELLMRIYSKETLAHMVLMYDLAAQRDLIGPLKLGTDGVGDIMKSLSEFLAQSTDDAVKTAGGLLPCDEVYVDPDAAKKAIKAQKKALAALEPGAEAPTAETPETRPATQEELDAALKRARVKMFSQPPEHMWGEDLSRFYPRAYKSLGRNSCRCHWYYLVAVCSLVVLITSSIFGAYGVPPELQPLNAVLEATVNASQVNEMTSAAQDAVER